MCCSCQCGLAASASCPVSLLHNPSSTLGEGFCQCVPWEPTKQPRCLGLWFYQCSAFCSLYVCSTTNIRCCDACITSVSCCAG